MQELVRVWVTLRGAHVHVSAGCQGIADGHAKAKAEGNRTYKPEQWPVHLAMSGFPNASSERSPCARCCPDGVPATAPDDADAVRRARGGAIATAYSLRGGGEPIETRPDEGGGESMSALGIPRWNDLDEARLVNEEQRELIASMYVSLGDEDGESFYDDVADDGPLNSPAF